MLILITLLFVIMQKNVDGKAASSSSSLIEEPLIETTFECILDIDCDDNIGCTDNSCDQISNVCIFIPNNGTCNDDNVCTDDLCEAAKGCIYINNNNGCNNGDLCTVNDICNNGVCVNGSAKNCNDSNPCTDDFCNSNSGCNYVNNNSPCNDGNLCSMDNMCSGGSCGSGVDIVCNNENKCMSGSCDPASGQCVYANVPPGTACDDGNLCTVNSICSGGSCGSGVDIACNSENECISGSCDPASGECVYTDVPQDTSTPCDDGNLCTMSICSGGSCGSGVEIDCADDGNDCTINTCDHASGECVSTHAIMGIACTSTSGISGTCNTTGQCVVG